MDRTLKKSWEFDNGYLELVRHFKCFAPCYLLNGEFFPGGEVEQLAEWEGFIWTNQDLNPSEPIEINDFFAQFSGQAFIVRWIIIMKSPKNIELKYFFQGSGELKFMED